MNKDEIFEQLRPYLFSIAYRMLATVMDAEDIVQEAYLRWRQVDLSRVSSPKSYLASIVTRLAIDLLRTASRRRETYVGPWLPEPLLTSGERPVSEQAALAESLTTAFLLLLERLSPTERAAFLLREVFAFDYAEIAAIVDKSEASCRQIVHRAKKRLEPGRPARFAPPVEHQERLVSQFFQAVTHGDVDALIDMMADDALLLTDSDGRVVAARRPLHGAETVARFFIGLTRLAPPEATVRPALINGQLGVIYYESGQPAGTLSFAFSAAGRIRQIFIMRNPEKLRNIPPLPDEDSGRREILRGPSRL